MHHRFLKFLSGKKPKRPYADPNQSMIDVISDAGSFNDSFRSVQPSLGDTSFTDLNNPARQLTETSPYLADYPLNASSSRANISSVFNIPKKNSIIEDLYGILQEHVVDQLGEMIQQSKKHHSEVKLLERIQARDFDVYIARLKTAYEKYRKINASRLQKSKGAEKVNVHDTLLKCYQFVPSQYFEDDFFFNFEYLTHNKEKIFSTQEDLGDYLDNVEVNLYYQISERFQAFLDVILKLNQMEVQIENSLYGIRYLRNFNHKLKNNCSNQIERTLRLKRRKINIEKTLGLIGLISVVKKTLPTLVQLIQRNNIESAVKLIKTSEDTYKNKLKQVKSLKNFNTSFNDARATLEKMLTSEFEDRCISYLTPTLSYNKTSHPNVSMEISMAEESFVNMSMSELINAHEDETPGSHQLYWTLTDCHTNTEAENNIVKIVLEYIKIKEFPLTTYKVKLVDKMKKFHQQFIRDMEEYISSVSAKDENPSTRNAPKFDLNIKFILFYFELYKRFITRQFKLNNKILSALVTHYNQNYAEKQDTENPQNLPVLDVKAMKYLNETVQEFYLAFSLVLKYFNDRITEIISMNNVEQMTVNQFAKLSAICQEILHYFDSDLKLHQSVNSWITTNKESIKKPLMNLASSLADKISIVPIRNLKIEYEKKFISSRYKHQYEELKDSLEQEGWQPADIPYAFGVYFNLFFGVEPNKGSIADKRKMSDADDILRSSRPDAVEMASTHLNETESILTEEVPKPEELVAQNGKPTEEIYSIKKNEIFVHNMRFKTTSSFLKLVQIIYEDYHIALRFKSVGTEAISKILEIIKFYNSYCIQLILGAGATTFGKIKKITAKTLALSSVSLSLLLEMVDPLTQRVFENIPEINHEWLTVEVNKLKNDLNHHVNEITSKIRTILKSKLIEQCNELKRLNWANAQEKINIPTKSSASILHNTRQMYKTIEDYLSKELLIVIFNVVFKDIKENFLPIFQNLNVESKLAAKRIKEELKYFSEDLYQIPIYQDPELKYADFEDKVFSILEEKCNHYLEATLIN